MIDLEKEVEDEKKRVGKYFEHIRDERTKIEEQRGGFERAVKRGEIGKILEWESMCAHRAMGVVQLVEDKDPETGERYRSAAAYCLENMGRTALRTGNNIAAANYLKGAADIIYQGAEKLQHRQALAQSKGREVGEGDERGQEYRKPEQKRLFGPTGQRYHLSALMAAVGIIMIVMSGMPHLTGGVIGGSATGYVSMIGGFLILLAIGLYFVKRK